MDNFFEWTHRNQYRDPQWSLSMWQYVNLGCEEFFGIRRKKTSKNPMDFGPHFPTMIVGGKVSL